MLVFIVLVAMITSVISDEDGQVPFQPPTIPTGDSVYFAETFNDEDQFSHRWIKSSAKKDGVDEDISKYDGEWALEAPREGGFEEDRGLVVKSPGKHHAIAAKLDKPFDFTGDSREMFVVQYEVNFQNGMTCGGAYMKLLTQSDDLDLAKFNDKTPYTIMFGPDRCGQDSKLHFIFRHKNPITGEFEEKHAKKTADFKFFDDKKTHLFTLIVRPDNSYSILVDQFSVNDGNLLEDFTPPINPAKEIDDPDDEKPEDWDEREKIPEPGATKPDDWDEDAPMKIPDPDAVKPEGWLDEGAEYVPDPEVEKPADWDDDMDGAWEPPMIPNPVCEEVGCGEWSPPLISNPNYKGKWSPPMVANPGYKGIWKPRRIPNPDYFEDTEPYKMTSIGAIGFELWTMTEDVHFDNVIITRELAVANNFAFEGWLKKYELQRKTDGTYLPGWVTYFTDMANDYPYLWLLYTTILTLPLIFLFCICCRTKDRSSPPRDETAQRKKTDEPSPDDPPQDTEEKGEVDKGGPTIEEKEEVDKGGPTTEEPVEESESFVAEDENEDAAVSQETVQRETEAEESTKPTKRKRTRPKKAELED